MEIQINMANASLKSLTKETAAKIAQWEYEAPYEAYSFKGHHNQYLMKESTWGTEQFCLVAEDMLLGQVSCQYDGADLWVGWAMAPQFCGKGNGASFVTRCVQELRHVKGHNGQILLRVSARNRRAIKAYQKAGFRYVKTIRDEIAYSNHIEDFWVMALSPTADVSITVLVLADTEERQFQKLENEFLSEIGEQDLTEKQQEQLRQAIRDGKITFFVAKHGSRSVGMCSVVKCFSTFACSDTGIFDDFYIEPAFRKKGVARKLVHAAQDWCKEEGIASLTVCCAPCDEGMYQSLGFNIRLGSTFAHFI